MIGETLCVLRGDTDRYGNPHKADHGTVVGAFGWGTANPSESPGGGRGESATTGVVELYVAKGTDLRARDRVKRANGQVFSVVAGPLWGQPHPLTGHQFNYSVYQLDAASG